MCILKYKINIKTRMFHSVKFVKIKILNNFTILNNISVGMLPIQYWLISEGNDLRVVRMPVSHFGHSPASISSYHKSLLHGILVIFLIVSWMIQSILYWIIIVLVIIIMLALMYWKIRNHNQNALNEEYVIFVHN